MGRGQVPQLAGPLVVPLPLCSVPRTGSTLTPPQEAICHSVQVSRTVLHRRRNHAEYGKGEGGACGGGGVHDGILPYVAGMCTGGQGTYPPYLGGTP